MENQITVFASDKFGDVRIVQIGNEPWFVGKDICDILGYQNGSRDINRHVDEEDRQNYQNGTFESNRGLTIINESGLYSLILSSKLPKAKEFKHWVTSEVLPAIRKHGGYLSPEKIEEVLSDPDTIIKLATTLKEEQAKRREAEAKLEKAKPVLETLPGWKCDITGIKNYADLPENCRNYIEFIEEQIGYPVTMVSNGPGREDIIYRESPLKK